MALFTTTIDVGGILPDDYGQLVVQPAMNASVAAQVATVVTTGSTFYRVPVVTADPTAAWVAEGAEIGVSDPTLDEVVVEPRKLAALTIVSRELADDSTPQAAEIVGSGMGRDVARKIDQAFFGALAAPAPPGLGALVGVQPVTMPQGVPGYNLDALAEAMSLAEVEGAAVTSFITSPATALMLAQLRVESGSNMPLLGGSPIEPTRRQIFGVPLYVSAAVAPNVIWGIDGSRAWLVVRDNATVEVDRSVYFTSDRVAIRSTMRVGFAFPHPASVIKVTLVPAA